MKELALDPVCGMPVRPDSPISAPHEGRVFFFCSTYCRDLFVRDPGRALTGPPAGKQPVDERSIAYFSMEIALAPGMPTYSGGLGVLAGDTLRACADLRVPVVALTLLHRSGYFRQHLDAEGQQTEEPELWSPGDALRPLGATVTVEIEGRPVRVRAWRYDLLSSTGEGPPVPVLFLDTDLLENHPWDRALCGALYGGDDRYRLAQEIVLGIGGVRMLDAVGWHSTIRRFHLNEGHAALAPLELCRVVNQKSAPGRPENPTDVAWRFDEVRRACVFTTHTPVPAGHDRFDWSLVDRLLGAFVPTPVLRMLGDQDGRLNLTALALNLAGFVNGVAQRHAEVSREMFPGYGIHHITNGVHSATWTAPPLARLYQRYLPGWSADPPMLRNAARIPASDIWQAHGEAKGDLLAAVASRTGRNLDPEAFTVGFARRATLYKRSTLVFTDLERLRGIARRHGRLQLVFGGKAHPRDEPGKAAIRQVFAAARALGTEVAVVYLEGYDLTLAQLLVAGCDLWLNNPQRPLEASGTSGMKAAHNGVPSLSVLDGWWIEGHLEGVTGWSIGDHAKDADGSADAADLYAKLEVILPLYYRDRASWIAVMRQAIAFNASYFNTHRMVQQYITNAYL